jgi:D-glycero-D-manno-heptose 1,7-bisphosphate phosphatase
VNQILSDIVIPKAFNNSLFLDRDGIINKHLVGTYVKSWDEFIFLPSVLETLARWESQFRYIFIVTNQRGVGKGVMTEATLCEIHSKMLREIISHGGRIDKIYYCTAIDENDINRKPNVGMALQAKSDFPKIDFSKSVMIGDQNSDMVFAQKLGLKGIKLNRGQITYL